MRQGSGNSTGEAWPSILGTLCARQRAALTLSLLHCNGSSDGSSECSFLPSEERQRGEIDAAVVEMEWGRTLRNAALPASRKPPLLHICVHQLVKVVGGDGRDRPGWLLASILHASLVLGSYTWDRQGLRLTTPRHISHLCQLCFDRLQVFFESKARSSSHNLQVGWGL